MCDVFIYLFIYVRILDMQIRRTFCQAMQLWKVIFVDMKRNLSNVMLTPRNANCGRGHGRAMLPVESATEN